jgi:putative endonuclease
MNNKEKGSFQESRACTYIEALGYKILEKNWRWSNRGEIDIIAIDPKRFNREFLIFIEVKYREYSMTASLFALDHKKIEQIKKLALIYLNRKRIKNQNISFDFIAISGNEIKHLKNIVS